MHRWRSWLQRPLGNEQLLGHFGMWQADPMKAASHVHEPSPTHAPWPEQINAGKKREMLTTERRGSAARTYTNLSLGTSRSDKKCWSRTCCKRRRWKSAAALHPNVQRLPECGEWRNYFCTLTRCEWDEKRKSWLGGVKVTLAGS